MKWKGILILMVLSSTVLLAHELEGVPQAIGFDELLGPVLALLIIIAAKLLSDRFILGSMKSAVKLKKVM